MDITFHQSTNVFFCPFTPHQKMREIFLRGIKCRLGGRSFGGGGGQMTNKTFNGFSLLFFECFNTIIILMMMIMCEKKKIAAAIIIKGSEAEIQQQDKKKRSKNHGGKFTKKKILK